MALRLHDHHDSTNALKVRFLLEEIGEPWESVPTAMGSERDGREGSSSPFGLVPVLDDGDFVLTESNTILRYLADRAGRSDLYPRGPRARARVDERMDALSLQVRSALWPVESAAAAGPVPAALTDELAVALDGFSDLIDTNGTCTGSFSIADCAAMGRLVHLPELPLNLGRWPKIEHLLATIGSRPAFLRAVGEHH
jgi:glutathione S-transferase